MSNDTTFKLKTSAVIPKKITTRCLFVQILTLTLNHELDNNTSAMLYGIKLKMLSYKNSSNYCALMHARNRKGAVLWAVNTAYGHKMIMTLGHNRIKDWQ